MKVNFCFSARLGKVEKKTVFHSRGSDKLLTRCVFRVYIALEI